jgi:hypothetical protein
MEILRKEQHSLDPALGTSMFIEVWYGPDMKHETETKIIQPFGMENLTENTTWENEV